MKTPIIRALTILAVSFSLAGCASQVQVPSYARLWSFSEQVVPRTADMAAVCHFWNPTIFAPGDKESCNIGTLYFVDLDKRIFYLGALSDANRPLTDRRLNQQVTGRDLLKNGGLEKLEGMRNTLLAQQQREEEQVEAVSSHRKYVDDLTTTQTVAGLESAIARYKTNDPNGLVQVAQERLEDLNARDLKEKAKREEDNKRKALAIEANRMAYIASLHEKYSNNLISSSPQALGIVANFSIDCRAQDGRYLPLINVLYATMASIEKMGGELRYIIESKGEQIRIYDVGYKNGKQVVAPSLRFEINEWGELRPHGITVEAILNSCFGSYGPIWEYSRL